MDLYGNTNELNEVLNMARNLPNANENPSSEAVQENITVKSTLYISEDNGKRIFTSSKLSHTYSQIKSAIDKGLYVRLQISIILAEDYLIEDVFGELMYSFSLSPETMEIAFRVFIKEPLLTTMNPVICSLYLYPDESVQVAVDALRFDIIQEKQ